MAGLTARAARSILVCQLRIISALSAFERAFPYAERFYSQGIFASLTSGGLRVIESAVRSDVAPFKLVAGGGDPLQSYRDGGALAFYQLGL